MNSYIDWCFPISEADGYHGGACRFMEASRRPGSHYNVMQPLKTSFAATGTDKMSRYSWDEAGGWKTICLCLRWCSEGDHCLKIKFRVTLGWKVKHMYQDFITLEMVVGNVLESGACFSSSRAILELWKSQYTVLWMKYLEASLHN